MFLFTDLPLDLVIKVFRHAVQQLASYRALCLVSKATRDIVLRYAFSYVPIHIDRHSIPSFPHFIESQPDVCSRARSLRIPYWPWNPSEQQPAVPELIGFIIQSCPGITSFSTTSTIVSSCFNRIDTFTHANIRSLYLYCSGTESTRKVNSNPRSQFLLGQVETLYLKFHDVQLFEDLVPSSPTVSWNFTNVTRLAISEHLGFPDTGSRSFQILYDRSIFPSLQQIVLRIGSYWKFRAEMNNLTLREYKYMLLQEAKRWQGLYLIFETKEEDFPEPYLWMDMGEAFWDAAIRLVDYGGDSFLDPPSLPDDDIFTCGESSIPGLIDETDSDSSDADASNPVTPITTISPGWDIVLDASKSALEAIEAPCFRLIQSGPEKVAL